MAIYRTRPAATQYVDALRIGTEQVLFIPLDEAGVPSGEGDTMDASEFDATFEPARRRPVRRTKTAAPKKRKETANA